MYDAASKFNDEQFLMKLASNVSNVFGQLKELNLQLQGRDKNLLHLADKVTAFTRKLEI